MEEIMRLIIVGCEYAGKSTLAVALQSWAQERGWNFHMDDHFTIPDAQHVSDEEQQALLGLPGAVKERYQRFQIQYHVHLLHRYDDIILVGFHIEEAIYGPRYYYPGLKVTYDRRIEPELPADTILALLTAHPDVIRSRMERKPHRHSVVKPGDVDAVQDEFESGFAASWVQRKLRLDTSHLQSDELLRFFLEKVCPQLNTRDLLRHSKGGHTIEK